MFYYSPDDFHTSLAYSFLSSLFPKIMRIEWNSPQHRKKEDIGLGICGGLASRLVLIFEGFSHQICLNRTKYTIGR